MNKHLKAAFQLFVLLAAATWVITILIGAYVDLLNTIKAVFLIALSRFLIPYVVAIALIIFSKWISEKNQEKIYTVATTPVIVVLITAYQRDLFRNRIGHSLCALVIFSLRHSVLQKDISENIIAHQNAPRQVRFLFYLFQSFQVFKCFCVRQNLRDIGAYAFFGNILRVLVHLENLRSL
ncbi:MAG: hypothetical protein JWM20_860 [Patescibacteria group bacterium]|nr:hypothetical protein [Patescibacteria group bacterium]